MILGLLPQFALTLSQLALTVLSDGKSVSCPDPEVTLRLLGERVGELAPPDHEVHHEYVTDAQSGHSYVRLRLYNANHAMLIERLIPVDSDCSDAPLAIAFILESYFASLPARVETDQPDEVNSEPAHDSRAGSPAEAEPEVERSESGSKTGDDRHSRLYTGLSLGSEGALSFELGYNYVYSHLGFLDVTVNAQLYKARYQSQGYQIAHTIHSAYLGSGISIPLPKPVRLSLVPLIGLHFQLAELRGANVVSLGTKSRWIGSVGIKGEFTFDLSARMFLGLGGRLNGFLSGRRYLIDIPNESPTEIYKLPSIDADGHLVFGFWF